MHTKIARKGHSYAAPVCGTLPRRPALRRRPGLLYLGVVLYIASYLLAATPLSTYAWSRGAHVTPAQQAYHELLVRLGHPKHHHAALPTDAAAGKHLNSQQFFFPPSDAVVGPSPTTPLAPGSVPLLMVAAAVFLIMARLIRKLDDAAMLPPQAVTVQPPHRPPVLLG